MKIRYEMTLDVEDGVELELPKLETKADWLFDPINWPEIQRVYDVRAELFDESARGGVPVALYDELCKTLTDYETDSEKCFDVTGRTDCEWLSEFYSLLCKLQRALD